MCFPEVRKQFLLPLLPSVFSGNQDSPSIQKKRLVLAPIMFALWHTAFVIHIFPFDETWIAAWAATILTTWISGTIWMWVLHRSGRLVPQCFYHGCANFLSVFPMIAITVLHLSF